MSGPVSMTGFGRAQGRLSDRFHASLVVRAVNHRYLDVAVRVNLREEMPELEALIRQEVERVVSRGRVSVQLTLDRLQPARSSAMVDREAVVQVLEQVGSIAPSRGSVPPAGVGDVLTLPGVVSVVTEETLLNGDETEELRRLAAGAVREFGAMRQREGERLVDRIVADIEEVAGFVAWVEPQAGELRQALMERLDARIRDLVGDHAAIEPERILQEAAVLADRADVTEELVRLRAHLDSFRGRLQGDGPIGRALDFLCQEIHRELNTIGSKFREAGLAERLVDAKTAAERVREQVQNLE